MSIVTSAELATYLRINDTDEQGLAKAGLQASVDAAEALVAAELGAPTLEVRAVNQTTTLPRSTPFVVLQQGPLQSLTTATLDGAALDVSAFQADPWMLAYPAGFARGQVLELAYQAGWDLNTLPGLVRQAIFLAGSMLYSRPDQSLTSAGMNDASFSGENTVIGRGALPAAARMMLRAWRNPRA